jgi:hypothetical protein
MSSLLDLLSRSRTSHLFLNLIKYARTSSWILVIEVRDRRRPYPEREKSHILSLPDNRYHVAESGQQLCGQSVNGRG